MRIEVCDPGANVTVAGHGGLELLLLEGSCTFADQILNDQSWLRLPPDEPLVLPGSMAVAAGSKTGHLASGL